MGVPQPADGFQPVDGLQPTTPWDCQSKLTPLGFKFHPQGSLFWSEGPPFFPELFLQYGAKDGGDLQQGGGQNNPFCDFAE